MGHSPGRWTWKERQLLDARGHCVLECAWCSLEDVALIAAAPEMLALLQQATRDLASEWLANHDEHCSNVPLSEGTPEVFHRKGAKCYCPAPASLSEMRALLARLRAAGVF